MFIIIISVDIILILEIRVQIPHQRPSLTVTGLKRIHYFSKCFRFDFMCSIITINNMLKAVMIIIINVCDIWDDVVLTLND